MSEKYRLIKHNENLAEIGNNKGLGLLFLVDEDCERKLRIIVDLLNKQQETISQLQDLCGKSDYENAKLRKELSDCEKFRYTVFKRLNDEYIKECSL